MKFSIKPLEKGAAPAPIVIVESPKGKSSHSWSRNIGLEDSIKVAVDKLDWEESPKAAAAPAPIVIVESPKGSIKGLSGVKFGKAAKEAKEKGSVFIAPVVSPPSSPKAAPAPMIVVKSPKAASPKAAAAAGRKAQVMLLSEIPDIAEFGKEHLKAFGAAAMGRQTLRKKTNLLEGLDLAKQPEKKGNKTRRLERYERLLREGRITEARRYMKRRNMLNEVMANLVPLENIKPEVLQKLDSPPKKGSPLGLKKKSSNSEPEHDFNLEVVNLDNYGSPSKKRSSSKSRKRASAKPSGSSQSRKVGTGVSFGKLAEALEKQAKQDAKQGVAFKPAPFSPKATYVIGLGVPADGKKGKHDISALHKKVVNLATSPTFKPHDPKKGVPFKPAPFSPKATYVIGLRGSADGKKKKPDIVALHKKVVNPATSPTFNPYDPKNGKWMG